MSGDLLIPPRAVAPLSQLRDVSDPEWHRRSCGIVALRMLMGYLDPSRTFPSIDDLITEGEARGAYMPQHGWRHDGLATLARHYGFAATDYDWTAFPKEEAFRYFVACLQDHPLIASVAKEFSPSKDGHLIVVTGIENGKAFVNDPLREKPEDIAYSVPLDFFLQHWSGRAIYVAPPRETCRPRFATWLDLEAAHPLE